MKKHILFPLLFALVALTSCSEEDDSSSHDYNSNVTYNFSASIPAAVNQTKAVSIARYILEVYKDDDLTTVVKRVEQAGGGIAVSLRPNTNYVCLLWADEATPLDNANGTYNASSLKNVTLNSGKEMEEAFFAKLDITNVTTTTFDVNLNRAVAQVNLVETKAIAANTNLEVTFNQYNSFNTYTTEVTGTAVSTSKTFNSATTTGIVGTFLTFASVGGIVTNFSVLYNSMGTNDIPNAPIKANYITNIRGNYSTQSVDVNFTATLDDAWIEIMESIEIYIETSASSKWIVVADRNADKTTSNGATAGSSATDYGYYFNNETNHEHNAYNACFNFGEGNGTWRLPTKDEFIAISGNGGANNIDNTNRKLKWEDPFWKLYDERAGKEDKFVYLPMAGTRGYTAGTGATSNKDDAGAYWSGSEVPLHNTMNLLTFYKNGFESSVIDAGKSGAYSVRCVKDAQ